MLWNVRLLNPREPKTLETDSFQVGRTGVTRAPGREEDVRVSKYFLKRGCRGGMEQAVIPILSSTLGVEEVNQVNCVFGVK